MALKRIGARVLLALLLALAQQALVAHPFSHFGNDRPREHPAQTPDAQSCLLCLVSAHSGHAPTSAAMRVCAAEALRLVPTDGGWTYLPATRPAFFLSRAPPLSL